jgi:anti-sigma factor RsiW
VEGSLGVGLEQAIEPYFLSGVALVGLRAPRSVAGTRESFAPRLTGSLAAGRVLPHGATLGIFTSALWQGDNSDDRGPIAGSSVALWTAGLAGTAALSDDWRLQSTAFADLPIQGLGRNQTVGFGGSLSLMKLWL